MRIKDSIAFRPITAQISDAQMAVPAPPRMSDYAELNGAGQIVTVSQGVSGAPPATTVTPTVDAVKFGRPCRELFFDTLFDDFYVTAISTYNFYTPGEDSDETSKVYNKLSDLPRYVVVSWTKAPALPQPAQEIRPTNFRGNIGTRSDVNVNGLQFDISRVLNFSTVRQMTVNNFLNIGTVDVRVRTGESGAAANGAVDEELYLISTELQGIPLNHITSNDRPVVSTVTYDQLGSAAATSRPAVDSLVQYRGGISIQNSPKVASVTFTGGTALGILAATNVENVTSRPHLESVLELAAFSTEFGLVSTLDDVVDDHRVQEPAVQSPEGLPPIEYIGYIIEKQVLRGGIFSTVEEIEVPDPSVDFIVDVKVAYGSVYRYRIRTVLRWTHGSNVNLKGVIVEDPFDTRTASRPLAPQTSHFVNSSWSDYETVAVLDLSPPDPPDELIVRVNSARGVANISWRFPNNPQGDISHFHLYRRSMKAEIFTSPWERLMSFPAANGRYADMIKPSPDRSERYVYAMTSTTLHNESSKLSPQISCRINPAHMYEGEDGVRQVSQAGVDLQAHGALSVSPPRRESLKVLAKRRVSLYPRTGLSKFVSQDVDIVLRLESLDTGQIRDILIDLNNLAVDAPKLDHPVAGRIPVDALFVEETPSVTPPRQATTAQIGASSTLASPR